jgi:glyoxylase-like metal-dependent hydrolase (beta-lactamase superfamily II)
MFGNAPRALWERWIEPDAAHRIPLACRALLVDGLAGRRVLFEAGVGSPFAPDLRARYGIEEPRHVLAEALEALGMPHDSIDLVVLSHLHFDHAGGVLRAWREGEPPALLFPTARFVVGRRAWERARAPHPRDRASFLPELPGLLEASGRLDLVDGPHLPALGASVRFHYSDGHTPGLMLAEIHDGAGSLLYCSDLAPGRAWVHAPITMGYDRAPELLVDEKTLLLQRAHVAGTWLFFVHDPGCALARVERDDRGRFRTVDERVAVAGTALGHDLAP